MEFILVPDTPGGFNPSIARRLSSSSATADMTKVLDAKRVVGRDEDEVEVRPLEVGTRGRKGGGNPPSSQYEICVEYVRGFGSDERKLSHAPSPLPVFCFLSCVSLTVPPVFPCVSDPLTLVSHKKRRVRSWQTDQRVTKSRAYD